MPDYDSMSMSEIYQLDASERIKVLNQHILFLEKNPNSTDLLEEVMREAHSLKAASRIVNHSEVQRLAHKIEEIFTFFKKEGSSFPLDLADTLLKTLDIIEKMIHAFIAEEPMPKGSEAWEAILDEAKEGKYPSIEAASKEEPPKEEKSSASEENRSGENASTIRIGIEKLDKLINLSGELYTNILNLERGSKEGENLYHVLTQLMEQFDWIETIYEQGELDPYKMKAWVSKNGAWLKKYHDKVSSYVDSFSRSSLQLNHLGSQLQDEVMKSRMLPVSTLFNPYQRFVRDLAKELDKKIKLEVQGAETQVDRSILELLKDPIMHLIRNTCDHGIEPENKRLEMGKDIEGTLLLSASHKAGRVSVVVEDDGQGLDITKIKKTLSSNKLISDDKLMTLTEKELVNFIFMHGFSTSDNVTETSGRGVGLDVVKSQLNQIGGTIQVETKKGKYTRFTLSLPLTLSVIKTLLVEVSGETFCLPLTRIDEVAQIETGQFETIEGKEVIRIREDVIPLVCAANLFGFGMNQESLDKREVVILGEGNEKIAFWVDRLLYEKEIVSKSMDSRLSGLQEVSGATVLDSGQVAFIINVDALLSSTLKYKNEIYLVEEIKPKIESRKKILIVEDSLTVRELEKSVLKNQGFDVETAVDGMDAYVKLKEQLFDLVVTDVEMPRMSGLELIGVMKKEERLSVIPTIIVSYRESLEDKRKGMEVGADKYLVKSKYDNKILLGAIDQLIGA